MGYPKARRLEVFAGGTGLWRKAVSFEMKKEAMLLLPKMMFAENLVIVSPSQP